MSAMKKGLDYVGVGIGAAIVRNGKVLLCLRGEKAKNERGKWETPGGGLEFGETMAETLVREMKEELDINIEVVEPLGVYDHIISGEGQHWVAISFVCNIVKGEPRILEPEKCAQIGWFTLEEAKKLPLSILGSGDVETLEKKYPKRLPKFDSP